MADYFENFFRISHFLRPFTIKHNNGVSLLKQRKQIVVASVLSAFFFTIPIGLLVLYGLSAYYKTKALEKGEIIVILDPMDEV